MLSAARRLFFGFSLLIAGLFFVAPQALAQNTPPTNSPTQNERLGVDENVPTNLHTATQVVMIEAMDGILCQLTGVDFMHQGQKCLGVDQKTGKIGYVDNGGGMVGVMGSMIGYTMTPPASSGQYVAYLKDNFGISKHAYAESKVCDPNKGIGFCGLWPVVNLWIAMRNIVYLIFILVFFVIGLGIMLRLHIDPQTVMSVQNQIPKIIVGILAITFSFAIAGFLIDVMWVATYLFASVLTSAAGGPSDFVNIIQANNPFTAAGNSTGGIGAIASTSSGAFASIIRDLFTGPANAFNNGDFVMGLIGSILLVIVNLLAWIIIAIAIVVVLVRVWFMLIISYLNIILDVIFAPFWILAGTFPGSPLSLGSWIRDLIANLAVFPLTISMFILAKIFMDAYRGGAVSRFVPPLTGGVDPTTISALIGLGFLLTIPTLLTATKAALKAPKINLGPITDPIRAGAGAVMGAPKRTFEFAERLSYANKHGSSAKEKLFMTFGNPIYYSGGRAESPAIEGSPKPGVSGKGTGSSGEE